VRRAGRIVLDLLTALSAVMFLATVVLWVRGYFVQDYVEVLENYRRPATAPSKFEFRNVRKTWDTTWGRVRYSSSDTLVGTYSEAQAAAAGWKPTHRAAHDRMVPPHRDNAKWIRTGAEGLWNRLGFFAWSGGRGRSRFVVMGTPYWAPAALMALLPAVRVAQLIRRRRRTSRQVCAVCGYDLRATPDRCPECGAVAATQGPVPI
jgi:hypothetical protein